MSRPQKPARELDPVETAEVPELFEDDSTFENYDGYTPIAVTEGDTFRIELTLPFSENSQTHWVKTASEIAVLPGETADDTADRAQEIALGLLFNTADRYKAILQQRRADQIASRNS